MRRTTIRLRNDLEAKTKAFAAEHEMTFAGVIEMALDGLLREGPPKGQRRKKLTLTTSGGSGIVDGLSFEAAVSRAEAEEDLRKLGLGESDARR